MIKAILFDVDGVLFNSFDANIRFYQDMIKIYFNRKISRKKIATTQHLTAEKNIEILVPDAEEKTKIDFLSNISKDYKRYEKYVKLAKNASPVIKALSKKYKLGIVTGRKKSGVQPKLLAFGLAKYFEIYITVDDYKRPKPHPEPILLALKKINNKTNASQQTDAKGVNEICETSKIKPNEAVYIGDTIIDMKSAKAAKTNFIAFTEFNKFIPENTQPLKAKHKAKSFKELLRIMETL
jgi:pyrophosphatase PpaX